MGIERVLSVNVFVDALDAARRHYSDGLALQVGRHTEQVLTFCPNGTPLNFLPGRGDDAELIGRRTGITLAMRGEGDLDRLVERFEKQRIVCDSIEPWRGGTRCHATDPAGNQLTLIEGTDGEYDQTMFEGAASVTLAVRDLYRSLDYYVGMLEIPMLGQPDANTAVLFNSGTHVVLAAAPTWSPARPVTGETGLCLHVEDSGYVFDMIQGKGLGFAEPTQKAGDISLVSIADPDGNKLTLMGAEG
jgi:catechol 2,3-dioxygenase-like lactoylglutathione lyase family enzyme